MAKMHAEMFKCIENNDLFGSREVYERMYPLVRTFYAPPAIDMHNRMKVALKLLGLQKYAVPRDPMIKVSAEEEERIKEALIKSRMLEG